VKQALRLVGLGGAALILQGVLATVLPPRACPDLLFLVVVATGLCAPIASGLLVAAALGYATDLLSSSLLGEHALLFAVAFGATRRGNRKLNLRGDLPRAIFVAFLTVAYALCLSGLGWAFGRPPILSLSLLPSLVLHAAVNALAIPIVSRVVIHLAGGVSDEEIGRRLLRFDARRPGAWRSGSVR
jgi:rod shape-determining protein MreD